MNGSAAAVATSSPTREGKDDKPDPNLQLTQLANQIATIEITEQAEAKEIEYESGEDSWDDDDNVQYCDCIAATLAHSLPGTPGKRGIIPYVSVYETQQAVRRRGYWIPGVPVNARVTKVEKNTTPGLHFINSWLYTIEMEHGPFKWQVVRNYKDFSVLNNRLKAHRAAERIRAPVRRAQEKVDEVLESVGVDIIADHKEDCPYYKHSHGHGHKKEKRESKIDVLRRAADLAEGNTAATGGGGGPRDGEMGVDVSGLEKKKMKKKHVTMAPLASMDEQSPTDEAARKVHMESAVQLAMEQSRAAQSGILENPEEITEETSGKDTTSSGGGSKKKKMRSRKKHHLPRFPMMPDSVVSNQEQRRAQLENWLQMVLHIPTNRNHHETAEFLEVSRYSFVNELGMKHTEGFVKKRPGGARVYMGAKQCCVRYCLPWSKRWLMVRDTFVAYMDHRSEQIRLVLLMDKDFKVAAGGKEADGIPTGLIIFNTQHELHLKCRRKQDTDRWKQMIESSMRGPGAVFIQPHRFASSYPVRENSYCKWFVDARSYMSQAADMMELAKEEIFIADWWLSPEIFMKRPALQGNHWRLDMILKRKAEQGVKVFVLMYKEMEMALGLNSMYSKRTLQELHPNIKVMRHPDHYPSTGTFFWAHHEKLIIIDQMIAFVGGVDLCFGRWDDDKHLLTDLGSVHFNPAHGMTTQTTPQGGTSMMGGLRGLVAASTGLGPLGLEEHEEIVPRSQANPEDDGPKPKGDVVPVKGGEEPSSSHSVSPLHTRPGERHVTRVVVDDETGSKVVETETETEETVFSDKETGKVMVKIVKKTKTKTSKRAASSEPAGKAKSFAEVAREAKAGEDGRKKVSMMHVVEEKKKHHIGRKQSAARKKVPREILDAAGPAPTMFEKAALSGMDMATAAQKYKEYVESGAVAKEKHRAQTPPGKEEGKKRNPLSRAVGNWKSNRAKRRWKNVLENDEVAAEYELDWIRLQQLETEEEMVDADGGAKLWIGKDYVNYIVKDFVEVEMPFHDFIDRGVTPRMPWHDIHSVTFGVPARDVARHFIQRWNATKTEKLKDDAQYPYLLPKSYDNVRVPRVFKNIAENVNVQVLRSVSKWSCMINQTEDSIQQAYLSLIANSKHYIYIENQFFVSMINSNDVLNEICKVIANRVLRAHRAGENYRVYITIPMMPGFEGDVGAPGGSSLQAVLHWTYQSISRGPNSLFEVLKKEIPDPHKYIQFTALRTYDQLLNKLVSEIIYVHCKLLIVDDEQVIIGSANINDRSQVGNRDSEVCVLLTDLVKEPSQMDGKPYQAGRFAKSLRMQCMQEHLGLLPDSRRKANFPPDVTCDDPVASSFFVDVWQKTAMKNTAIYEEVFRCFPTDQVETFEEFTHWTKQSGLTMAEAMPQKALEKLRDVNGVLVDFPLNFLSRANLTPGITSKEGLVPTAVFT